MTVTLEGLLLYAGALVVLWLTPGPVFVALTARALTGGFRSAWPLAVGVTLGDLLWPTVAIFGLSWFVASQAALLHVLRWIAALMFAFMGAALIRHAARPLTTDGRLTRPGLWAGFSAGVLAILGNPKAILFYMGMLPSFFDLKALTVLDILAILLLSMSIPLAGNLLTAALVGQSRALISNPAALTRVNRIAGALLVLVGIVIAVA